jgi:glycerol kinase
VFVAGSLIQWLRDDLNLIAHAADTEPLARSVPDNGGVYLVPALSGLGAPHWVPNARGAIMGLSFAANKAHIARAALEAMAHQTSDLKNAFAADGADWGEVRIDGGMVANDWMAQDLSDVLNITVERPAFIETTALGAAMLASVGAGLYKTLMEASAMRKDVQQFQPKMDAATRTTRLDGWANALARVL